MRFGHPFIARPAIRMLALAAAWLIALCSGYPRLASALRPAQRVLNDLSDPDQLRQLFESDKGKLRILALLSPT